MSDYYRARRTRNIFKVDSSDPFKISRSKIDLFLNCPRCFYIDRRLGIGQPPGYPFNLNTAVDTLLKKEFDVHRAKGSAHPLMKEYGVDAIPFDHSEIDNWRENFVGVQYLHEPTNLLVTGAVDDVWVDPEGNLIVVDYKATAKEAEVTLDAEWQIGYKRQMEIYQWLLRRKGFDVKRTGFFVYCNGRTDSQAFDGRLEFRVKLIPYEGNDEWVEPTLIRLKECLVQDEVPEYSETCDFCMYYKEVRSLEEDPIQPTRKVKRVSWADKIIKQALFNIEEKKKEKD